MHGENITFGQWFFQKETRNKSIVNLFSRMAFLGPHSMHTAQREQRQNVERKKKQNLSRRKKFMAIFRAVTVWVSTWTRYYYYYLFSQSICSASGHGAHPRSAGSWMCCEHGVVRDIVMCAAVWRPYTVKYANCKCNKFHRCWDIHVKRKFIFLFFIPLSLSLGCCC